MVLSHAPEVQILDIDGIETTHEQGAELMQRIAASIGDLFMESGDAAGLCPIASGALLPATELSLRMSQQGPSLKQGFGIRNVSPLDKVAR